MKSSDSSKVLDKENGRISESCADDSDRAGPWHISTVLPEVIEKLKQRCGGQTIAD